MEEKVLQMVFKNTAGEKVTISVDDPKDTLTEAQIKTAMETIIEKNIFMKNNYDLISAVEAKIVTKEITEYDLVV